MFVLISIFHVILCIALILIVLLQTGKGSDLASAFGGGGSQAMFGGRGPASFLNKMTTIAAVLFMVTSITLAYLSAGRSDSLLSGVEEPKVEQSAAAEGVDKGQQEENKSDAETTSQSAVEKNTSNVENKGSDVGSAEQAAQSSASAKEDAQADASK